MAEGRVECLATNGNYVAITATPPNEMTLFAAIYYLQFS